MSLVAAYGLTIIRVRRQAAHVGAEVEGDRWPAPSCARVIYEYYGGDEKLGRYKEMLEAADKADSAQFSREEILNPLPDGSRFPS